MKMFGFTLSYKGELYPSNLKLKAFLCYLKIINTFLENYASGSKLSKEVKNGTMILVGHEVCKLCIKTVKMSRTAWCT